MPEIILSINAGSSSIKVSVFSYDPSASSSSPDPTFLALIEITSLTSPPAKLTYQRANATSSDDKIKNKELPEIKDIASAYKHILETLISDSKLPELSSKSSITFACHRVVHGGEYNKPLKCTSSVLDQLSALSDLAPLHNTTSLSLIHTVGSECPDAHNIAFFDSAFHSTIPLPIRTYAINPERAAQNNLRKFGFHGLSYAFILRSVAAFLKQPVESTNIIALHLGSGCSATAIKSGKSLDTTMGLTPLSGLPGATRSGDVDPSLIFHLTHDAGAMSSKSSKDLHVTVAEKILNSESGWKALTGTTDFGEISSKAESGEDEKAKLAFELVVDRLVGYIGSYYVKLDGKVDALVFAGGMGEKGAYLRAEVAKRVKCLGFEIDEKKNEKVNDDEDAVVLDVSSSNKAEGGKKVLVCRTDEQTEMARECVRQREELMQ